MTQDGAERQQADRTPLSCTSTLALVLGHAQIGWFDYDPRTGRLEVDHESRELLGWRESDPADQNLLWVSVHPADRPAVTAAFKAALDPVRRGPFDLDCRLLPIEGPEERWIHATGETLFDGEGADARPVRFVGIVQDISRRKRAEAEAAMTRDRLERAQVAGRVGTFEHDLVNDHVTISGMDIVYGVAPRNLEEWFRCIHPDDRARLDAHLRATLQEGATYDVEYRVICPGGSLRWVAARGELQSDEEGRPARLVGVNIDITQQKRAEEALRESDTRFRLVLRNAPVAVAAQDLELRYVWAYNARLSPEGIVGKLDSDLFPAEEAARFTAIKKRVLEEGIEWCEQRWVSHACGSSFFNICLEPIRDEHGQIVGVGSAAVDLTPMKRAQDALLASEEKYRSLFENSLDAIILSVPDGRITEVNQAACDLFGYSREELLAGGRQVIRVTDQELLASALEERARTGRARWQITCLHKDDRPIHVDVTSVLTEAPDGSQRSLILIRDITELVRIQEELLEKTRSLEAVNRELEAFTSSVSHDLRAPLRAIRSFSQLLLEKVGPSLKPDAQRYLGLILKNSTQMGHLIEDLLELAKTSRGELEREDLDATAMVADVWRELREGQADLVRLESGDLPTLYGDRTLLRQVFANLLENALKYTRGREDAFVSVQADERERESVVMVRDNGIGFDMKHAERIFEPFQRLHGREAYEGTGIGLATVRRAVERHGGRAWAESARGEGSTFFFTLPKRQ